MDIKITNLSKSFGENVVLKDFSATFPQGNITCIMGASGCGKTTLLNIILGLLPKDGGEIEGLPQKISAVFQENRLFNDFSVIDNLKAVITGKESDLVKGVEAMGLKEFIHAPVSSLSGGMKRRVALLRALESDSDLIVMDEPFKGLDEDTKDRVMDYTLSRLKGRTAIVVTHDPAEAEKLGNILKM
jgi:NitT/TauT family transport system ATP-binding protein